jgi:hypothetical protein
MFLQRGLAVAQTRGRIFSPSVRLAEAGGAAFFVSIRARMASERAMPASAPPVASNPAQNALPITALKPGTIGRKNPIRVQARQVRIRKAAFAATLIAPRLAAAMRRLANQRSAKTAIVAAIRMDSLLFPPSA